SGSPNSRCASSTSGTSLTARSNSRTVSRSSCRMGTNTRASKARPTAAGPTTARSPLIAPDRPSPRSRRRQRETLSRTSAASSVTVSRPLRWSSARIFRSMSSMREILPQQARRAEKYGNTFGRNPPNLAGMDTGTLLSFLALDLMLVCVPGADWAYAISAGLRGRSVAPAVGGLVAGYALHTALAAAGLAVLVAGSPVLLTALTVAGAGYLVWLGWSVLRRPGTPGADRDAPREGAGRAFR